MLTSRTLLLPFCGLLMILAACSGPSNGNKHKNTVARQLTPVTAATFAGATSGLPATPTSLASPTGTEAATPTESATSPTGNSSAATAAAGSQSQAAPSAASAPAAASTSSASSAAATRATATRQPAAASTPAIAASGAAQSGVYTVVAGDTLVKIAARLGISTQALIGANPGITPDALHIDQKLTLPVVGAAAASATAVRSALPAATAVRSSLPASTATRAASATAAPAAAVAAGGGQTYTIQAGDTACKIAGANGVSLQALADANDTTPSGLNSLHIGQKLSIPASSGASPGC